MGETISALRQRFKTAFGDRKTRQLTLYILVPVLVLLVLWLPPIAIGNRLFHLNYPLLTAKGGAVGQEGGARLSIPAGALSGNLRLQMWTVDTSDAKAVKGSVAQAVKAVPANLQLLGPLYTLDPHGSQPKEAHFTTPLPEGVSNADALDLYAWTGKAWEWVPGRVLSAESRLEGDLTSVPKMLAVMEAKPQGLAVGVAAPDAAALNATPPDLASEVYVSGLALTDSGSVTGKIVVESAPAGLLVLPVLSNHVGGVTRADWVANLISNPATRSSHVQAIVQAVRAGGYKGLSLEYLGLDQSVQEDFSAFVSELAEALHQESKTLAVRVDEPKPGAEGKWDTTGYHWPSLAQAADLLRIPVINGATANGKSAALMEDLLRSTVGQLNRQKVQLILNANCYEQVGSEQRPLVYGDALSLASKVEASDGQNMVLPGETISVTLPNLEGGLQVEADTGQSWFSFKDEAGVEHKVWLENAGSVAHKLALAMQFSLRGVAVEALAGTANDARIWDSVRVARDPSGRGGARPLTEAEAPQYSVVWQVRSKDGQVVSEGVNPADDPEVNWKAVDQPGEYTISVAISEDGGKTTVGVTSTLDVQIPTPTPSPTPTNTPTPKPTLAPAASKPAAAPAPAQAPAVAPKPSGGGFFGYGIQVHAVGGDIPRILDLVQQIGFGWVKQQVEWYVYNPAPGAYNWGGLDALVDACAARGIKVLLSVCKAPAWARPAGDDRSVAGPPADPNTMAEFMRQMASRYKGRVQAYEIWNEQNLWYEWGGQGHRLSAANYVALLKASYSAVKSVDPGAIIVSGALTPTGANDGNVAIRDSVYLEQMYQAGLKNYCDAIGAHPSGYNNPPDADWRTWTAPGNSQPRTGDPTWFFRGTMESYRAIMQKYGDGNKRIWPTEFGWGTTEGYGVGPARGYEYEVDNSLDEQAQYIVRAYQMGKNWGFVGPMFLWNLNFGAICAPTDEKAAFSIIGQGWAPRPAFHALANMPK